MSSVQYMTAGGVWLCSCQEGTDPPEGAIPAPADAAGFHGMEGLRWDGGAWVIDALDAERSAMVADKWQIVAILDLEDPALWQRITDWAEGRLAETEPELPLCDPITRSAIRNAITIPRLSQIVDLLAWLLAWDGDRVDQLFRLSMALRG